MEANWQQGWLRVDMSHHSPQQTNGCDCGVFTLTSMDLLQNGLQLTREAYSQGTLARRGARRRLAKRIWEEGAGVEGARWQPNDGRASARRTTGPEETNRSTGARNPKIRKRSIEGRMVPGSRKTGTLHGHFQEVREKECGKKGGKRSAKSEAEEEGGSDAEVRIYQPPTKKAHKNKESR